MKIESTGNMGTISGIAPQTATPQTAAGASPAPAAGRSGGSGENADIGRLLGMNLDKNLSQKLKDPEMKEEFDKVLDYANKLLFNENSVLKFSRHEATNTTMVKLIDSNTKEVLREFPSEKILNIIAGIWEVAGLIVNEKA